MTIDKPMWQVSLVVSGGMRVSREIAQEVSRLLGGDGSADVVDEGPDWILWMINMPSPYDGEVELADGTVVTVHTPLP